VIDGAGRVMLGAERIDGVLGRVARGVGRAIDGVGRVILGAERTDGVLGRVTCGVGRAIDGAGLEMRGVGRTAGGLETEGLGFGRAMDGRDDEMLGVGREGRTEGLGAERIEGVGRDEAREPRCTLEGPRERDSTLRDDPDGP